MVAAEFLWLTLFVSIEREQIKVTDLVAGAGVDLK